MDQEKLLTVISISVLYGDLGKGLGRSVLLLDVGRAIIVICRLEDANSLLWPENRMLEFPFNFFVRNSFWCLLPLLVTFLLKLLDSQADTSSSWNLFTRISLLLLLRSCHLLFLIACHCSRPEHLLHIFSHSPWWSWSPPTGQCTGPAASTTSPPQRKTMSENTNGFWTGRLFVS